MNCIGLLLPHGLNADKAGNDLIAIHDAEVISLPFFFLSDPQNGEHAPDNFRFRNGLLLGGLGHHFHDVIGKFDCHTGHRGLLDAN